MIKILALLSPLFATFFWAILLNSQQKTHSVPRSFLSKLMLFLLILNLSRFFHRAPLPELYAYFDVLYMFVGTISYPLYHIYFRLLTVDERFSLKAHYPYLILPTVIGLIYFIVVLATPFDAYKVWLFDRDTFQQLPQMRLLKLLRVVVLFAIDLQAIYYLVHNVILLKKYGNRAEQFYSNIDDGKYNNGKLLNLLIIFNCLIHVANALNIVKSEFTLVLYSVLYAVDYYMIGYMGFKQKAINPTFDLSTETLVVQSSEASLNREQMRIKNKLLLEFEKNKIYLNSELTILDVVQLVGKNRTYISSLINQEYGLNFCAFVNSFRINELERIMSEKSYEAYDELAERAGFGSVKSMKRAVLSKTGLTLKEWRKQLEQRDNNSIILSNI